MNVTLFDIQSLTLDFPQAAQQTEAGNRGFPLMLQQNLLKPPPDSDQAIDFNELIASGAIRANNSAGVAVEALENRWQD